MSVLETFEKLPALDILCFLNMKRRFLIVKTTFKYFMKPDRVFYEIELKLRILQKLSHNGPGFQQPSF
jgi:hypothetical protein